MVGTRSGIKTYVPNKKTTKNKVIAKEDTKIKTTQHGVHVKGLTYLVSADDESGGARHGKSLHQGDDSC